MRIQCAFLPSATKHIQNKAKIAHNRKRVTSHSKKFSKRFLLVKLTLSHSDNVPFSIENKKIQEILEIFLIRC